MNSFNFTTGLVITGFTFQHCDLAVSQFNTVAGHFFFQCLQALFDVLKVVVQPDGTGTTTGDKNALFAQVVAGPVLTVSREYDW
ncbi:hypothetical protein ACS33_14250 [Edwardsiella ictaluri]|nr:hypothetical protein ABY58_14000 [Edwardsiella ictaluri]KOO54370.1 hypothetical protein ACS33_14250 [Edwardsiella ictaluri]